MENKIAEKPAWPVQLQRSGKEDTDVNSVTSAES